MQDDGNGDSKRQNAAQRQEEALQTTIWKAIKEESRRRDKAQRYFSNANNWIAVLTFGVVVVYTLVTGALWVAQLNANAINGAAYEASNRPWIMLVKVEPTTFASDNEAGVDFSVKMTIKNVGHSPAQNVSVSADLTIDNFDPLPDQAMINACQQGQTGSWVIPGQPVFPDQTQIINGETGSSFLIPAQKIWAARAARIKAVYNNRVARESKERAQAWADAVAQFPFHAPLYLVRCINYRSPNNRSLYQTSFMLGIEEKGTDRTFPLLSKDNPPDASPTPMPDDPGGIVVHPRQLQRIVPGDQIKLSAPLYGTFAS